MDHKDKKGQILVEVLIVGLCLVLVFTAALSQLSEFKKNHYRSQFSKENSREFKNHRTKK